MDNLFLNESELSDFEFDKTQLIKVSFDGSSIDNVKMKNSTLEEITFYGTEVYKEVWKEGILIAERIPIEDYSSFLKEINLEE